MHPAAPAKPLSPSSGTPRLLGWGAGGAWQVTQPRLWPLWMYLLLAGMGLAGLAWRAWRAWAGRRGRGVHRLWAAVCAALLVGGVTGWRAPGLSGPAPSAPVGGGGPRLRRRRGSPSPEKGPGLRWCMG